MPAIAMPPAGLPDSHAVDREPVRGELALRFRVARHRAGLTQRLAAGADPRHSAELALRARQLVSERDRRTLARTIERTLKEARHPAPVAFGLTRLQRRAILEAERPLRAMVARLRDDRPVAAEGMALIDRMITDGVWSPLYNMTVPGALRRLAVLSTAALEPDA